MAFITISRSFGSFGDEIARGLTEKWQCNSLDKEAMEGLLHEYGITDSSIQRYDEKKPAFWATLSFEKNRYINYLKMALFKFAQQKDGIILGRGGQFLLAQVPGILHVRITAPEKKRIERVKQNLKCSDRHAELTVRQNDRDRAGFHKTFFHKDWDSENAYDMVVNTSCLSVDSAIKLIDEAAAAPEISQHQSDKANKLTDLELEQKLTVHLLYEEVIAAELLGVEAKNGVVTLTGSVHSFGDVDRCKAIAAKVSGVKEVKNDIHYISS